MAPTLACTLAVVISVSSLTLVNAAPKTLFGRQITSSCTSSSFTTPSWYIRDFRTGSETDATFNLLNRVTNSSAEFTCRATRSNWSCAASSTSTDPSLKVALRIKEAKATVDVQQSWSCNDRNPDRPISFTASGTASIPLSCESTACKSSNPLDLVRGALKAPVELNPAYAEGPPGHDKPGCSAVSEKPRWTVGTVIYLNESGSGVDAIATHSIQFQVTNQANGYVAGCLNYFDVPENEDPAVVINCGGGTDFVRRNRYSIRTQAVFYPRSRTLMLNETWFCDDVDAAKPVSYTGTAKAVIPLVCVDEDGRTACEVDEVDIHGELASKTDLVPYSIEDPLPTADGCTISSVVNPSWTISNFGVDKKAPSSEGGSSVAFNIKLNTKVNLFDYPVYVNNRNVDLAADAWYPCTFGAGEQPLAPKSCTFKYDEKTSTLSVKADWVCADLDVEYPILFSGVATTKLPELDCVTTAAGVTRCRSKDGLGWTAEVNDVVWRTEHKPVS